MEGFLERVRSENKYGYVIMHMNVLSIYFRDASPKISNMQK